MAAVVIPESGAVPVATPVQNSLEITVQKPAADAKVGVSLVGSPPLVHQVRAGGLGAAAGLRLHDRVVSVNGLPVSGQEDAAAALAAAPAGPLVVVVERPAPPPPDAHVAPITTQPGVVQVLVPPGPIGIQFRGTTVEKVLPSSPLRGHVWPDYALKTVNGMEATAESLLAERGVLEINDDGSTPRTLVFRAPTPAEIQAKVHDIVRKGGTLHSSDAGASQHPAPRGVPPLRRRDPLRRRARPRLHVQLRLQRHLPLFPLLLPGHVPPGLFVPVLHVRTGGERRVDHEGRRGREDGRDHRRRLRAGDARPLRRQVLLGRPRGRPRVLLQASITDMIAAHA